MLWGKSVCDHMTLETGWTCDHLTFYALSYGIWDTIYGNRKHDVACGVHSGMYVWCTQA